ncbi:hypothetical protein [Streptomyces collinus]|uniref:Uncharacterized protein n=1 Tax=Streptomyces collinus (strain DSM 40733 / Tue 365) TaxID=1214242 RepID=S5UJB5_STRC3|nr:hypothetical protein [Streptomyces collinus]AGS66903.1 hypothetical protein B446_00315 [Streptomyces collinus Tu 365]AGS73791.1 hypothetical protein B446_34975 [Streptomyces collinus Tu 365]
MTIINDFLQGLANDGYPFTADASDSEFCMQHGWHTGEDRCPDCYRSFLIGLRDVNKAFHSVVIDP